MHHLLPVVSLVGGTRFCDRLGNSDVIVWYLKVATIICGCEACRVIIFLLDLSSWSCMIQVKTL